MKVAIHHSDTSFSRYWIEYCKNTNIPYKIVSGFNNDIINELKTFDVFLWHHHHAKTKDVLAAKKIIFALEMTGVKVYPDFNTCWHFDDKIAQKYLLEAHECPIVNSYIFYSIGSALKWVNQTSFPKVFKLKGGAGASNVKLVRTKLYARFLILKSFTFGYPKYLRISNLLDSLKQFLYGNGNFLDICKAGYRFIFSSSFARTMGREKGYVYFQDFLRGNNCDTRVVVVAGKYACAERRFVRKNDFRASGSGIFSYDDIDENIIKISFEVAKKLKLQSVAFDFIYDEDKKPLIVEISYGFGVKGLVKCPGYWTDDMVWHSESFRPEYWIIEELILSSKNSNV